MHSLRLLLTTCLLSLAVSALFAAGGTAIVASKGQPAYVQETWPDGVAALVNDPARTTGWNDWFSEWPNDVNQYAMEVQSVEDVNRLIEKLAAVKADVKEIRLCAMKEPAGLGWVTRIPEGNKIAVMFSIGDQTWLEIQEPPWRIVYRILDNKTVEIHGVLDGRRSLEDILMERLLHA